MITRIALKNFKAFKEAEINLNALNLFTGLNGMGKSSFIQSMLLLRQSASTFYPDLRGLVLKGANEEIVDLGKGKDIYHIHADTDDDLIRFTIDEDFSPFLDLSFIYDAENDVLQRNEAETSTNHPLEHSALFTERFTYLKADRVSPEHYYKANISAVTRRSFLGYRGENFPLYIALKKFDSVELPSLQHEKATTNNIISNLDAWLSEITPGSHVISTYFNDLDIVRVGFQFDVDRDLTPQFSPVNAGFGLTHTLPILIAVLSAKKGDLIIIENPECHLHPQGQAKLGEFFARAANDGVQIVIESHSDHLFNGMRVAIKNQRISPDNVSVFYFERKENSTEHSTLISEPVIDKDGRVSHHPKGFFDEYSKQLDALIR